MIFIKCASPTYTSLNSTAVRISVLFGAAVEAYREASAFEAF